MRMLIALALCCSSFAQANIPQGKYQIEKIQCKSGKVLKLGGKFMVYKIYLDVGAGSITMTATANSGSWAPFKLNCTQVNEGQFTYTQEGKYEGDLPNKSVKCNAKAWEQILRKKLFGVEEYGTFNYQVNGNQVIIYNPQTITKYSCDQSGDYPIYHYKRI